MLAVRPFSPEFCVEPLRDRLNSREAPFAKEAAAQSIVVTCARFHLAHLPVRVSATRVVHVVSLLLPFLGLRIPTLLCFSVLFPIFPVLCHLTPPLVDRKPVRPHGIQPFLGSRTGFRKGLSVEIFRAPRATRMSRRFVRPNAAVSRVSETGVLGGARRISAWWNQQESWMYATWMIMITIPTITPPTRHAGGFSPAFPHRRILRLRSLLLPGALSARRTILAHSAANCLWATWMTV